MRLNQVEKNEDERNETNRKAGFKVFELKVSDNAKWNYKTVARVKGCKG